TRRYQLDVAGNAVVRVRIKSTVVATGGAPTARIFAALNDGVTEDTTTAAQALTVTNNTLTGASFTLPPGVAIAVLELTIPVTSSLDFTNGVAEYSAK